MQKQPLAKRIAAGLLAGLASSALALFVVPLPVRGVCATVCEAASYIDETIRPVQLNVHTHRTVDYDERGMLLRSSVTRVSFVGSETGEVDKALGAALWRYNEEALETAQTAREGLLAAAKHDRARRQADGANFFPAYETRTDLFVRRADTLAVSLLACGSHYTGGARASFGVMGKNFDARTGRLLGLDDVFTDRAALADAIAAQLRRDYPSAPFMEDGGVKMAETAERMAKAGTLVWTFDPCGASFYFPADLFDSQAGAGVILTATLLFDERPGLFREAYRRAPRAYCMELCPFLPVRATFADGSGTAVQVTTTDGGVRVMAGGVALDDRGEASGLRPVLVSLADGRRYLYVDAIDAGDAWETTYVYDLSGGVPVRVPMQRRMTRRGDVDEDFAEAERGPITIDENRDKSFYLMADPELFSMTLMDEETGKACLAECRVGADGAPEILQTYGETE